MFAKRLTCATLNLSVLQGSREYINVVCQSLNLFLLPAYFPSYGIKALGDCLLATFGRWLWFALVVVYEQGGDAERKRQDYHRPQRPEFLRPAFLLS